MNGQDQGRSSEAVELNQRIDRLGIEPKTKHAIEINEVMQGFVVKVGCKILVFETKEKLLAELKRYLENRNDVEKEYLEKYK